jgi:predicted GIY-YIG superfamily endonuclease
MSFWSYMLKCGDGSYYTGHTDNLEQRIGQHQTGLIPGYTSQRLPVLLVWSQDFATREEALSAELQVKRWSRTKKEALVRGEWGIVQNAARKKF